MRKLDLNKFCASNFSYFQFPIERFLDDARQLGIDAIELWGAEPHLNVDEVDMGDLARLRKLLKDRGQHLLCFTPEQCIYPINIAAKEDRLRERSVKYFFRCIEICNEMSTPMLFLTSGWGYEDEQREDAWKRARDSISRISDVAAKAGVSLVLEALQPVESNVVNTVQDIERMRAEVNSPALKVAIDTVGMAVSGNTVAQYMKAFGSDVLHTHFIDGTPAGHMAWGDGNLPLDTFISELAAGDYTGYFSFELVGPRYWLDPIDPLRRSIDAIRASIVRQELA